MKDDEFREQLKSILLQEESLLEEKRQVSEERKAIWIGISEAIRSDDDAVNIKAELSEYDKKAGYIKIINGKIKGLKKQLIDIINGKGEYDADQLSLFSVDAAKEEAKNGVIDSDEDDEDDDNFLGDEDSDTTEDDKED